MSLLSDPEARPSRWTCLLWRLHQGICSFLCVVALVWFCLLAHKSYNSNNYFSENALLPGLVKSEFIDDGTAERYLTDLNTEIKENYQNREVIPTPWLSAMMHQINLDVYTHNFTLHYPLGKGQTFRGENVYGILRAGRSASTEALVLSSPYRSPSSQFTPTNAGIALMLAFAKFARSRKYWAKDIIFLVTEHEQLGAQAWLEAYHGAGAFNNRDLRSGPFHDPESGSKSVKILDAGNLKGRSGAIQAAINLELPALSIKYIDVKIEGLNGQLPNLDLVNLVHKMCVKSNVHNAYKNSYSWVGNKGTWKDWLSNFSTLLYMMASQLTGVPTGNHGLFHRYGIEAVTMEGIDNDPISKGKVLQRGKPIHALEGTFRSLNNLLERFHQSFFFYLRPAMDRFISIGQYMPPFCILIGTLFVRAFALWLSLQKQSILKPEDKSISITKDTDNDSTSSSKQDDPDSEESLTEDVPAEVHTNKSSDDRSLIYVGLICLVYHVTGYIIMSSPQIVSKIGVEYFEVPTETAIFYGLMAVNVWVIIVFPPVLNSFFEKAVTKQELLLLNIIALLELATLVLSVGMHNFSLGFFLAVVYTPTALFINVAEANTPRKAFSGRNVARFIWVLLHPLFLSTIAICCYTFVLHPEEKFKNVLIRGITTAQQPVMYSVVDSMIYGNWFFNVITVALLPTWMMFWQVLRTGVKIKTD